MLVVMHEESYPRIVVIVGEERSTMIVMEEGTEEEGEADHVATIMAVVTIDREEEADRVVGTTAVIIHDAEDGDDEVLVGHGTRARAEEGERTGDRAAKTSHEEGGRGVV